MTSNHRSTYSLSTSRRVFIKKAGAAAAATGLAGFPLFVRAAPAPVKVGLVHPVTGFLAVSGSQCRAGALMAIKEINAAGGIKSLGGAMLEPVLGDAQSKPEVGTAEVEKMNEAGVVAIVGAYGSGVTLATTQAAAKYGIPHVVDVGIADPVVTRGLTNVFRFPPSLTTIVETALEHLVAINDAAGKPAKTVLLIHEESAFGTGVAKVMNERLPGKGFQIVETIKHANPTRDFNNIVLKIKAHNPDIVIPSNYYDEAVLLARTMQQQKVSPKCVVYAVPGGAASHYKFVKEFPEAAQYIMDCNHWINPRHPGAQALRKQAEAAGLLFTYELFLAYEAVQLLADALERAAKADRQAVIQALASSTWSGHFMPYGPTRFVNGQNQGARPLTTQILSNDIQVIMPPEYATAKAVFPVPPRA
jgi:branched-chain amino acid transport system substrate-binding protein